MSNEKIIERCNFKTTETSGIINKRRTNKCILTRTETIFWSGSTNCPGEHNCILYQLYKTIIKGDKNE